MPNLPATWLSQGRRAPKRRAPLRCEPMRRALDGLIDALPSQCAVCSLWPARRLCADCCARWATATPRCQLCAIAVPAGVKVCGACLRGPAPLSICLAAVDYAYPWHRVIADFKFRGDTGLARSLAALMLQSPQACEQLARCDALVPMPLSPQRLCERGFHQTLLLARALARQQPVQILAAAAERRHTGTPQHDLARAQRLRQLRTAFAVAPDQRSRIEGRRLLLLDDVMTTGASLHALAQCLRRAGAAEVGALVLARTPL